MAQNQPFQGVAEGFPAGAGALPEEVWAPIIGGMEKVVHRGNQIYGENGTAWSYIGRDIEYRMAGKSGTAQVVAIEQGEVYEASMIEERKRKHAWFIAFAPIEDPKIALAVLLENGGGGSENAAPVAREIIDYYLLERADRGSPDVAMVSGR
jgi:penicillin-binding protein 2